MTALRIASLALAAAVCYGAASPQHAARAGGLSAWQGQWAGATTRQNRPVAVQLQVEGRKARLRYGAPLHCAAEADLAGEQNGAVHFTVITTNGGYCERTLLDGVLLLSPNGPAQMSYRATDRAGRPADAGNLQRR